MKLEASQAELEALERDPRPPKKKTRKRDSGKPRDELGRFTKPVPIAKGKRAAAAR